MDEDVYPFLSSVVCKVIFTFGEASCAIIHVLCICLQAFPVTFLRDSNV